MNDTTAAAPLFEQLCTEMARSIADGVLRPGSRLPSLREASKSRRLSLTTVKRAYLLLESQGLIEGRPKSGYFVRMHSVAAPARQAPPPADGAEDDVSRIVLDTLQAISQHDAARFGSPYPDPALFPWRRIQQRMGEMARRNPVWDPLDDIPPGRPELLREIARRHLHNGLDVDPREIVVTTGATEAINLCLRAVAKPGQAVAVESPGYFGMQQAVQRLGMRAIEIPADAQDGIDLDALAAALAREPIAALLSMPNHQNPLGFVMPDARKQALVALARSHGLPIIENGVLNELYYGDRPPTTLRAFDPEGGTVLHCGSFSKSLAAGVRLGWTLPGRWRAEVEQLKFLNTVSTAGIGQLSLARYLAGDSWDYLLRGVRRRLLQRRDIMRAMLLRFFPPGTRCTLPQGGYLLWVELPEAIDGLALYRQAMAENIAIAPGRVFGVGDRFRHCLRLNYSCDWTASTEADFHRLATLVNGQRTY